MQNSDLPFLFLRDTFEELPQKVSYIFKTPFAPRFFLQEAYSHLCNDDITVYSSHLPFPSSLHMYRVRACICIPLPLLCVRLRWDGESGVSSVIITQPWTAY
jgi:hypothetical protein